VAEINGTAHSAEMHEGAKSQFDVFVDDELVFSKQRQGRYPELADVLGALT
jgi:predicted Rdx family selenoprotein